MINYFRPKTTGFRLRMLAMASIAGSAAQAQQAPAPQQPAEQPSLLEQVTVTATRIVRAGFTAPTPTTELNVADLQLGAPSTIGEALSNLPSERATETPVTSAGDPGHLGFNIADLRGLGTTRTLVLVNGQRPVFTSLDGFDLNTIPLSLVQRVDIVTGGASAAWGSDAVSGVINVILDDKFTGVRGSLQYGSPTAGPGGERETGALALGGNFGAEERGHFMVGVQYAASATIPRSANPALTHWYIGNPAYTPTNGQPQQILVPNANFSIASLGGLILGPGPLAGTAFGPGGVPYAFQLGQYSGVPFMSGGGPEAVGLYSFSDTQPESVAKNGYGQVSYDVTSNFKLTGNLLYANTHSSASISPNLDFGNILIQSGNPFLPPSIQSVMSAQHIPALIMGRVDTDFNLGGTNANNDNELNNRTTQFTLGAEGSFGSTWTWNAHYSYGENRGDERGPPQEITDFYQQSIDAVANPVAGGPPVCRIALTIPSTSCVPVNLFGSGSPSAAAMRYFLASPSLTTLLEQNEAAATVQGEPFSIWAGPVSIAAGGEYRRESVVSTADPLSQDNRFARVNLSGTAGAYSVHEGFVETVVPLVRDVPALKQLDFNGAVRVSHYDTSGSLTSWKLGLTDEVTDELRIRGTYSQDIRAPNLSELYTSQSTSVNSVFDPVTGTSVLINDVVGGNPDLRAEQAHTLTYGAIYKPSWLSGFEATVDWYAINIHNAITTLDAQTIVQNCYQGVSSACSYVTRNNAGVITSVLDTYVNLASESASGLDVEAVYDFNLARLAVPGNLKSHLLMTYIDKYTQVNGLVGQSLAGYAIGLPRWRGTLDETYQWGPLTADLRARVIGAESVQNQIFVDNNSIGLQAYLDLSVQYKLRSDWIIFGSISNLTDRGTPPQVSAYGESEYDLIGRTFAVGVRFKN